MNLLLCLESECVWLHTIIGVNSPAISILRTRVHPLNVDGFRVFSFFFRSSFDMQNIYQSFYISCIEFKGWLFCCMEICKIALMLCFVCLRFVKGFRF